MQKQTINIGRPSIDVTKATAGRPFVL